MNFNKSRVSIMVKNRFLFLVCLGLLSCQTAKKVPYFQNIATENQFVMESIAEFKEPKIQVDDILTIDIVTIDPSSSSVANQGTKLLASGASTGISSQEINGYIVDKSGEVEIALIGKVKLIGLTTYEAKEVLRTKASDYFKNPTINIRYGNFKVSVLGEVNKPASYTMPSERVSVLDILSLAGDLTLYGKRDNILVIRQNGEKKEFGRLNLNSTDFFKSPYYYLKQNDVVYVEPSKAKVSSLNAPIRQNLGIALSAISVLALAFSRLF